MGQVTKAESLLGTHSPGLPLQRRSSMESRAGAEPVGMSASRTRRPLWAHQPWRCFCPKHGWAWAFREGWLGRVGGGKGGPAADITSLLGTILGRQWRPRAGRGWVGKNSSRGPSSAGQGWGLLLGRCPVCPSWGSTLCPGGAASWSRPPLGSAGSLPWRGLAGLWLTTLGLGWHRARGQGCQGHSGFVGDAVGSTPRC